MKNIWHIAVSLSLAFSMLLGWQKPTCAGVPAPVPGPSARLGAVEIQIANLGDFQFENGQVVKDFKVSYVTHGRLNENKDNIILAMHHGLGDHSQLNFLIGEGKALDTNKYFIVATDALGNCNARHDITTGPTNSGLKMKFPRYTIRDMVNADYRLLNEHLGFEKILAAIGSSTGGNKAFQFGVSYPEFCRGLIPIAGAPLADFKLKAAVRSWMQIIELDSGWYGGNYEQNPLMAYHTWEWTILPWIYSPTYFTTHLKTEDEYRDWERMWDGYLHLTVRDTRDIYYWMYAWGNANVGDSPGFHGDAKAALNSVRAEVLIIGNRGDMFCSREGNIFAESAIPNARYLEIDNCWGHMTCVGFDPEGNAIMQREIAQFLEGLKAHDR